jgi:hypothetical protein
MKWAAGDLWRTMSRKSETPLSNSDRPVSEFYFARTKRHSINTTKMSRFAGKEVIVICLSFTNVRISIVLPGAGVSFGGGVNGTYSGK